MRPTIPGTCDASPSNTLLGTSGQRRLAGICQLTVRSSPQYQGAGPSGDTCPWAHAPRLRGTYAASRSFGGSPDH